VKTTGPFVLVENEPLTLETPVSFPVAVILSNNSPYLLQLQVSNKTSFLSPNVEALVTLSHTTQSFSILPLSLSGVIASGGNHDIYATWFDKQDEDLVSAAALNRPVGLAPNSVASGSTVSGNVTVIGPVNAAGYVLASLGDAIPAGGNNIGSVDVASAIPAGSNNIGNANIGSYSHISSNTSTAVKSSAGTLHKLVVNNPGTAWVAEIYDGTTSDAVVAIADLVAGPLEYGLALSTGLTVVTSGTAAGDLTVVYN
jgi:hypothetical protein